MKILNTHDYLESLLQAPRPGQESFLAFYDHRIGAIGTDPRLLLIPLDDHICHRGDGLFESICFRRGRIFALDAHIARMKEGASALSITPPCSWETIQSITREVACASKRDDGDLRIFLSRGPGGFSVAPSECPTSGLYVVALAAKEPTPDLYTRGVAAFTSRIPPKQAYLATIKNTNYLPNVFMAAEAKEKGMDVAVSFDEHGIMGEAAVANIALIDRNGDFLCPEFTNILPGTTLLSAMRLLGEKRNVRQCPITHKDIFEADEVLLLTSSSLCVPVTSFDGVPVSHKGKPGPVAHKLKEDLLAHYLTEGLPIQADTHLS